MPPRRRSKRSRKASTPPHFSPSPPPAATDPEPRLPTPPPQAPPSNACLQVFQDLDIADQICAHLERVNLKALLRVSKTFYLASSRKLYSHVELTSAKQVMLLIKEGFPARMTRRHAQKTTPPLACLKHTQALTLGEVQRSSSTRDGDPIQLPSDWKESIAKIFPNVKYVLIRPVTRCRSCRNVAAACLVDLWNLAGILGAIEIALHLSGWPPLAPPAYVVPPTLGSSVKTLTLALMNCDDSEVNSIIRLTNEDGHFFSLFEHVRLLYDLYVDRDKCYRIEGLLVVEGLDGIIDAWEHGKFSYDALVHTFAECIGNNTNSWTLYMIGDIVPGSAWAIDASLRGHMKEHMGNRITKAVAANRSADCPLPKLAFRSRSQYIREAPHHPLELGIGAKDRVQGLKMYRHVLGKGFYGE